MLGVLRSTYASFVSELMKLRRRTLVGGALAATLIASTIGTLPLFFGLDSTGGGPPGGSRVSRATLELASGLSKGLGAAGALISVVVLCLAAMSITNEFAQGTIRNLLVRQPRRGRILAGKVAATAALAAGIVVVATLASVALMAALAPSFSVAAGAWWSLSGLTSVTAVALRLVVSSWLYLAFGLMLGFVTKSAATSIGIGVAWMVLAENLLGGISDTLTKVFPGKLAEAFVSAGTAQIGFGLATTGLIAWFVVLLGGAFYRFREMEIN